MQWHTAITMADHECINSQESCSNTQLYAFFWVIPWRLNFICQRFGTLCLFHLHRQVGVD